jgi:hypothetical protein
MVMIHFADGSGYSLGMEELKRLGAAASPETAIGSLLPKFRVPLLYPDMPLDVTLHHFERWPVLLVRNRARGTVVEGVVTEAQVLACFRAKHA